MEVCGAGAGVVSEGVVGAWLEAGAVVDCVFDVVADSEGAEEEAVSFVAEEVGLEDADEELEDEGWVKLVGSNSMGRYSMERLDSSLQQSWLRPQHQRCEELPAARLQGVRNGYLSSPQTCRQPSSFQSAFVHDGFVHAGSLGGDPFFLPT